MAFDDDGVRAGEDEELSAGLSDHPRHDHGRDGPGVFGRVRDAVDQRRDRIDRDTAGGGVGAAGRVRGEPMATADAAPAARARTDAAAGEPGGGAGTGNTQEPVAWAADIPGKYGAAPTMLFGYTKNLVKGIAAAGGDLVEPFPLYRTPQTCPYVVGRTTQHCSLTPFTLTDEEREAVRFFSKIDGPHNVPVANKRAATLRVLLERLG